MVINVAQVVIIAGPSPELVGKDFLIRDGDVLGSSVASTIVLHSDQILPQHIQFHCSDANTQ